MNHKAHRCLGALRFEQVGGLLLFAENEAGRTYRAVCSKCGRFSERQRLTGKWARVCLRLSEKAPLQLELASAFVPRRQEAIVPVKYAFKGAVLEYVKDDVAPAGSPVWWDTMKVFPYVLRLRLPVSDPAHPDLEEVVFTVPCPVDPESDGAAKFWRILCYRAALHEADEHLIKDGKALFDPHVNVFAQKATVDFLRKEFW